MVGDAALPKISLESAAARLTDGSPAPPSQSIPVHLGSVGPLLRNCAEGPILSLDDYISQSGFSKLRNALEMAPEEVIALVETSGLRGRGGAGFPTGAKWRAVHRQPGTPKYLICNADESEPGTFKDRFLLANNPFLVLEGMAIAAYATGAQKAYLFLRFEYNNEFDLLSRCIRETEEAGLLGEGIQGSPFSLEIQPFRSAGGYICGEETALIEAIEGRRGEPRLRPPYPTLRGLWGQPTLVNNVETLANIPLILAEGPEKFAAVGTEGSKGTKLFCLSGDVAAPGLYEAPLGTPLGQMLKLAGTEQAKAVLLGGAAGRLVPAKHVGARYASPVATARQANIHLDFENGAANGAIIVLNDSRCVLDVCLNLMEFFTRECCGLCLVGREGTAWALTLLRQACAGKGSPKSLEALKDVAQALSLASRCGLGQTAANGILGALQYFPEEVEAHFLNQSCPLGVCRSKNK
jgi:NADH:ubiquinone oxidoreductase subunit F (NADH-binding)